jgi:hypothetical protein
MAVAASVVAGCGAASTPTDEAAALSASPTVFVTPATSQLATPTTISTPATVATPTPAATPSHVPAGSTLSWKSVLSSDGDPLGSNLTAAVAFGDGFVVAGNENQGQHAVIWYSADGKSWQKIDKAQDFSDGVIGTLVPIPQGLLAVGTASQPDSRCGGGAFGCNAVSAIRLWTSPDGRAWHALASSVVVPFGRAQLIQVVSGPSGVVAFGELVPVTGTDTTAMVWNSPNGLAWEREPQFSTAFPSDTIVDLAAGPAGFEAVGSRSAGGNLTGPRRAWFSSDGKTWKLGSGPATRGPTVVMACTAGFFGVDNPSAQASFWTTADGVKWTVQPGVVGRPDLPTYVGQGLFSDGNRILAIGADSFQTPGAWLSTDGRQWESIALSGPQPPIDTAVAGSVAAAFSSSGVLVTTATQSLQGATNWTIWLGTLSR